MNVLASILVGVGPLLCGCNGDPTPAKVDFSATISTEESTNFGLANEGTLRVAVGAMVSPKQTFASYRTLLDYLGSHLGLSVRLVQRKTYAEINDGLATGLIDMAFICSGPYVIGKAKHDFRLLAAPEIRGKTTYQAYLIVNARSSFARLEDLRGKTFAFTDPDSNTGRVVPLAWLSQMGESPETFFERTVYTYGHDNSILAVSRNLVDAASVDGLVWDYLHEKSPEMVANTLVIRKSDHFGIPPVVCSPRLAEERQEIIRRVLLNMHNEDHGRQILRNLMIDKFVVPPDDLYDSVRDLLHATLWRSGS